MENKGKPVVNDFLAQVVANVSNENNPGLNITPDDPRVQEHAITLEKFFGEMLKGKTGGK